MVWTELKDRFTQQNGPRIFQLRRDLATLRQDRDSVSTYFEIKSCWLSPFRALTRCSPWSNNKNNTTNLPITPLVNLWHWLVTSCTGEESQVHLPIKLFCPQVLIRRRWVTRRWFHQEQYRHLMSLIQPKSLLTAIPLANQTSSNSKTSATPPKMSGPFNLDHDWNCWSEKWLVSSPS